MPTGKLAIKAHCPELRAGLASFRRKLSRVEPELKDALDRRFAEAADPVLNDLRTAIKTAPGGHSGTNVRDSIANATRVTGLGANQTFRVYSSWLGAKAPLPALYEKGGWFHPTWGRWRNNGAQWQDGKPWFATTIESHDKTFRNATLQAAEDVFERLNF